MKMNHECLPCLIRQVVKIVKILEVKESEELYHRVFKEMSHMDFQKSNPEIIGSIFHLMKEYLDNDDPYQEIRETYNHLLLSQIDVLDSKIHSLEDAILFAIIANVIDFHALNHIENDVMMYFENRKERSLTINHVHELKNDLSQAQVLLYLGDNCGEICLDYLLIKKIHELYPQLHIYFATRGYPVVNDNIEEDAYLIGMDEYATIINNGDDSLGTVLKRTRHSFQSVYQNADVIIAKGQGNFESLNEDIKNIYFLFIVKCDVIAQMIGEKKDSLICLKNKHCF